VVGVEVGLGVGVSVLGVVEPPPPPPPDAAGVTAVDAELEGDGPAEFVATTVNV